MRNMHEITEAIQQHPYLDLEQQIEAWQAENELLRAELEALRLAAHTGADDLAAQVIDLRQKLQAAYSELDELRIRAGERR